MEGLDATTIQHVLPDLLGPAHPLPATIAAAAAAPHTAPPVPNAERPFSPPKESMLPSLTGGSRQ
eukprot:325203-Pelagomonas_calceolata.AAC.1